MASDKMYFVKMRDLNTNIRNKTQTDMNLLQMIKVTLMDIFLLKNL